MDRSRSTKHFYATSTTVFRGKLLKFPRPEKRLSRFTFPLGFSKESSRHRSKKWNPRRRHCCSVGSMPIASLSTHMTIYWRLDFYSWRAWYCQNLVILLVTLLNSRLNGKAIRWIISRLERSVAAIDNDSLKSYHALARELGSSTAFVTLADECATFRDIWTLKIGDLKLWQCLLALPPWFFNSQSPFLKFSSAVDIYQRFYDMWSLQWGLEDCKAGGPG